MLPTCRLQKDQPAANSIIGIGGATKTRSLAESKGIVAATRNGRIPSGYESNNKLLITRTNHRQIPLCGRSGNFLLPLRYISNE